MLISDPLRFVYGCRLEVSDGREFAQFFWRLLVRYRALNSAICCRRDSCLDPGWRRKNDANRGMHQ